MMSRPTYWFWERELSPQQCKAFIDMYFSEDKIEKATVNPHMAQEAVYDEKIRKSDIVWAEPGTELFNLMFHYIKEANEKVWKYDLSGMESVQVGKYSDGGHYVWHTDTDDISPDGFERKLSCSIQLTEELNYEGGNLFFKTPSDEYVAPRTQGTIIVFPSALLHQVTPVTSGTRYSAVSWMRGPAFK